MSNVRFVDLDPAAMTDDQKRVFEAIKSGPRGGVAEPFRVLLQSPELADRVQALGAFARFGSSLPPRLSELAIIITARFWNSPYEWHHHVRDGLAGGVPASEIEAISRRERPDFDDEKAAAVYDFATELHTKRQVSDGSFARAKELFGIEGVIDLIGILGHYTLMAMVLNTFEVAEPDGTQIPLEK
ncbi:MAG: carboxymuconolactone decarboxylase family protein [Alphaproteobacteria bacterium]|nr:carboxymuconolactone decarboxylase family protein [Alphaproteobacteria bacterium]